MVELLNELKVDPAVLEKTLAHREKIYEEFKKGNRPVVNTSVSSFVYVYEKRFIEKFGAACYAGWHSQYDKDDERSPMHFLLEVTYTSEKRNKKAQTFKDAALAYLDWGLNHSVWTPMHMVRDPEDVFEKGAVLNVRDQDANWLFMGGFVTRNLYEHPSIPQVFAKLIPLMSGELANMFAHMLYHDPESNLFTFSANNWGHRFITGFSHTMIDGYLNHKIYPKQTRRTGCLIPYKSPLLQLYIGDKPLNPKIKTNVFRHPDDVNIKFQDGWFVDSVEGFKDDPESIIKYVHAFAKYNQLEDIILPHLKD